MDLELEIRKLQERNVRVDQNKAWEKSLLRRGSIMLLTFLAALLFLLASEERNWKIILISALIPSLAYFVSTLTLRYIRYFWEQWKR